MPEVLGLPRGSVRAILAIILVAGCVPVAVWAPDAGRTFYAAIATLAVNSYFHSRRVQNEQDGPALGKPSFNGESE